MERERLIEFARKYPALIVERDKLERQVQELKEENEQKQLIILDLVIRQEELNHERKAIEPQLLNLFITIRDWVENKKFDQLKDVIAEEEYLNDQLERKDKSKEI